jgi:hypothetical protein
MRRIAISWLILCAALFAAWQMQTPAAASCDWMLGVANCSTPASGGGSCAASTTFLARTSGLSGTESTAYDTMICGMITDGVGCSAWSGSSGNLDALYIFATNTTTTANLNLCGTSHTLTQTGTVTFSADHGYTGDGSTGYLATGINPCAGGFNATQNSETIGAYVLTNRSANQNYAEIGASDGTNYSYITALDAGAAYYDINGAKFPTGTSSNAQGSWAAFRSSSSDVSQYTNESSNGFTGADTSTCVSETIDILALGGSSATLFSADQLSAAYIGASPATTPNIVAIQHRINAYMTALGINVY